MKIHKEYHFGVVAYFDEDACHWRYEVSAINGDDSPFAEMSWGEVYNRITEEWEFAYLDRGTEMEQINDSLLNEAMDIAQARLERPRYDS